MDATTLITHLRERYTPTASSDVPGNFVSLLRDLVDAAQIKAEVMLGGSYAKGTYLEGDHDIDVFVRFDKQYEDEEMPDLLGLALGGWEGVRRIHGSRDYFQLEREGFSFEVVPVLKVDRAEDARNVTDVSPLHVQHVKDAVAEDQDLAADIRLAKVFCKAAKVYGAESYINGFSGHVLDNLILHYGSFLGLVEAAAKWGSKVFIDPSGKHADAGFLNKAKRMGPLVLLDPIQPERNAAAALSKERFVAFKEAAKRFLERPDESFFIAVPLSKEVIAGRGEPCFTYITRALDGSKDVAGTKLLKAHEHFVKRVKEAGFTVRDSGFEFFGREAFNYVVVKEDELSETHEVVGPPRAERKDAARFREAHPGKVQERDGRLYAVEPRPFRTLAAVFSAVAEDAYFKGRVAVAKVI